MMDWMSPCEGMMIIGLVLIILAIVALIKWISGTRSGNSDRDSALDILRDRYAHGKINKKEFEERKQNLNK